MRWRIPLVVVPALFVAAGCDQQPAGPADDSITAPAFNTVVNTFEYWHPGRITFLDDPNDWDVLLIGYDPADDYTCNGGVFVGGITVKNHYAVSQGGWPFGGEREQVVVTTIGSPPLYLYLRADFPPPGASDAEWCTFLTQGWIAAGHWSAVITSDNDASGGDGTPGMNTWGGTETGVLVGNDGTRYKYSWKYRLLWNPDKGFFQVARSVDMVERIGN